MKFICTRSWVVTRFCSGWLSKEFDSFFVKLTRLVVLAWPWRISPLILIPLILTEFLSQIGLDDRLGHAHAIILCVGAWPGQEGHRLHVQARALLSTESDVAALA